MKWPIMAERGAVKPNMRVSKVMFLFFVLLVSSGAGLAADETTRDPTVTIGAYENSPKIYIDDQSVVSGFWPDLIAYIAAKEHWHVRYRTGTWSEGLARLESGEIDIMPDVAFTEARSRRYIFSDTPELLSWTRVYVHSDNQTIRSVTDLEGKRIAVLKNSVNVDGENGLREMAGQFSLHVDFVEMADYQQVFKAIEAKTVDAGITNRNYGNHNAHAYRVKKTPIIFQPIGMRFAFSPQSPLSAYLVKTINTDMALLQEDSESVYYQLLKKYFEAEIAVRKVREIPDWVTAALKMLFATLLFFAVLIVLSRVQVKRKTIALKANEQLLKHEISKLKHARDELNTLSQAVEQAGESILITDREGFIQYVNPAFSKSTGFTLAAARGKKAAILNSHQQDDGEAMLAALSNGNIFQGKAMDQRKDGSSYPILLTVSPIKDESGEIVRYVAIQQDLSAYQALEEQFLQAQKMEAIGTLVGGIAHDFNNMLAGITGNLYMVKVQASAQPELMNRLAIIEGIAFHGASMIQQLLTFARKGRVKTKPMLLRPFVQQTINLLRSSLPENINLHQRLCDDSLPINGDATQLHQVLLNLVNNARDAVADTNQPGLAISLECYHADAAFVKKHPGLSPGDYARLSLQDNGEGMDQAVIQHLFEPFFTTKEQGKGTGLGLAMVFGAVKTHQGAIDVESVVGVGTQFHIYIPLQSGNEAAEPIRERPEIQAGHGETILLVDDQQGIIDVGVDVLTSLGYRVLTASDGQQAVDIVMAKMNTIALMITDVVMPVMGGREAAAMIRQLNPSVKIIFSTGYDKDEQAGLADEVVISKPFAVGELSHVIRQQLDG